jgi:heme/copper-type cytochrome/quinol oxidase subunit 2
MSLAATNNCLNIIITIVIMIMIMIVIVICITMTSCCHVYLCHHENHPPSQHWTQHHDLDLFVEDDPDLLEDPCSEKTNI